MMGLLTAFVLKPMLLSVAVIAVVKNSRLQSANYRYFILSLGFVLLICSLLLSVFWPSWVMTLSQPSGSWLLLSAQELLQSKLILLALFIYAFVVLWLSAYSFLGWLYLNHQAASTSGSEPGLQKMISGLAQQMGITREVRLVLGDSNAMPCTWGVYKPIIQLPQTALTWSRPALTMIVLHELAHVRNHDFGRKMFARQVAALFWFIPWLWWMLRRSEEMAEQAADNRVLNFGQTDSDYAEVLVNASRGKLTAEFDVMAVAGHGDYYQRVLGIMDRYADRSFASTLEYPKLALFGLAVTTLLACLSFTVQPYAQYQFQWPQAEVQYPDADVKKPSTIINTAPGIPEDNIVRVSTIDSPIRTKAVEELKVIARPKVQLNPMAVKLERPAIQPIVTMSGYLPVNIVSPNYPRRALRLNLETEIVASFSIDINGQTRDVKIIAGQHQKYFSQSVKTAIAEFKFVPPRINGEKVQLDGVTETFTFKIEN